jgi:hypothetical protein
MAIRRIISTLAFLVLAGLSAYAFAQSRQQTPVREPFVLSGNDIGFRVEARSGTTPVGRLVVRIGGEWVEADYALGTSRVTR